MKKSKIENDKLLTDVELELMNILWDLKEGSVADVIEHLSPHRNLAYTSVSTMLRILEQKSVLTNRKEGRGHVYIPLLKKNEYEARSVKHMVDKVFNGAPLALVKQLLESSSIAQSEIDELKILLSRLENKR